jgi:hypothetical protein
MKQEFFVKPLKYLFLVALAAALGWGLHRERNAFLSQTLPQRWMAILEKALGKSAAESWRGAWTSAGGTVFPASEGGAAFWIRLRTRGPASDFLVVLNRQEKMERWIAFAPPAEPESLLPLPRYWADQNPAVHAFKVPEIQPFTGEGRTGGEALKDALAGIHDAEVFEEGRRP